MFRGQKQGGGGSAFVTLTGLFQSKKGTGLVGSIKPEAFPTIIQMMEDCEAAGTELVMFVAETTEPGAKTAARLSATVGKPREQASSGGGYGNKGGYRGRGGVQSQRRAPAASGYGREIQPRHAAKSAGGGLFGGSAASTKQNPPEDPLDSFLEDIGEGD